MPSCPRCGAPLAHDDAPCGACAARARMHPTTVHRPRAQPLLARLLEQVLAALVETLVALWVALVETGEAITAAAEFCVQAGLRAVIVTWELFLAIGRAAHWSWWWMVARGARWEKTGWALGLIVALFLPASLYVAFGALGLRLGLPWWIGASALGFLLALLGRWVGRQHDQAETARNAPPLETPSEP